MVLAFSGSSKLLAIKQKSGESSHSVRARHNMTNTNDAPYLGSDNFVTCDFKPWYIFFSSSKEKTCVQTLSCRGRRQMMSIFWEICFVAFISCESCELSPERKHCQFPIVIGSPSSSFSLFGCFAKLPVTTISSLPQGSLYNV